MSGTGIMTLKERLSDVPGIGKLTMRYADGGLTEIYMIDGREFPVPAGTEDVASAIRNAREKHSEQ